MDENLSDMEPLVEDVEQSTDHLKKEGIYSETDGQIQQEQRIEEIKRSSQENQVQDSQQQHNSGFRLKRSNSKVSLHQRKGNERSDSDPQQSSSFQVSKYPQQSYYSQVSDISEEFVEYFVNEFEAKLHAYHLFIEGETKKAGKFSDAFAKKLGQGVGGATGGLVGLLFGLPGAGANIGAAAGKAGGGNLGSMLGNKKHTNKVTELLDLIDRFHKDKNNFRQLLVEAGFDIFQSFEMQFMRITSPDQGQKTAMQLLARDATNRAINYYIVEKDACITEAVILGKSKIESIVGVPIASAKIKTPGLEINYKYKSANIKWYTASLYEKVGLVIEGKTPKETSSYYEKQDGKSRTDKYGYRRLFTSERWKKLKEQYKKIDNTLKSSQFTDYQYILDPKSLKQKAKSILEKINLHDKDLVEDRIKKIIEDVKKEILDGIDVLKKQSYGYKEDFKIFQNLEEKLNNLNVGEYLKKFKENFEEAQQDRKEIAKSIEASRVENRENFNQLNQKQDFNHDDNQREHKKTQEGIKKVEGGIEGNSKKINEIHEVVVAQKNEQTKEPIWFNMKEQVKSFTGRDKKLGNDELGRLHNALQSESGQVAVSQVVCISGLGGLGKSELARKYAYDHRGDYESNALWISSETQESLRESFHELAKMLNISITEKIKEQERDVKSIVKDVYEYFHDAKSLFIFDNAEEYKNIKFFLPHSLPPDNKKPYILITSRNQNWNVGEEGNIEVMKLDDFTPEEAVEFIRTVLDIKDQSQKDEIKKLAESLQHFPLALYQATAYIKERNMLLKTRGSKKFEINDYLTEYEKEEEKTNLLNFKSKHGNDRYIKTVFTTWKITLKNIEQKDCGKEALEIIRIMAYLAPDKISIEEFLLKLVGDKERLWNAIELLKQYSMINAEEGVSSVHRLVQEVTRLELKNQEKEEVLKKALELINSGNISEKSISHVTSVWSYASKHGKLIDDFYFNSVYGYSATPLHLLAENNSYEAVKVALEHIKKYSSEVFHKIINANDKFNRTPLFIAAENGCLDVVKLLVNQGAKIDTKSSIAYTRRASGWTSLHIAASNGHLDVVKCLVNKNKALVNIKDSIGRTPLNLAVNSGHFAIIAFFKPNDEYLLHGAVACDKLEYVDCLIQKGVDVNFMFGEWTPLHLAAFSGYLDIAKLLIRNQANIKHPGNDGFTPLHAASNNGRLEVVKLLIDKGADPKDINEDGWTSLHAAAQNGQLEVVRYFIKEQSIDVNILDKKGTTPLQTAAFHGKLNVVEFLLGEEIPKKADIDAVDILGATPLFSAALNNNRKIVEFLLNKKAVVINSANTEKLIGRLDFSVLHIAAAYDAEEIVKILVEKYVDKDVGKDSSLTPLHIAAFFGSSKVIQYLINQGAAEDISVKFSNIIKIFNDVKEDSVLKISSIHGVVNKLLSFIKNFGDYLELTPGRICRIFNSPDRALFSKNQQDFVEQLIKPFFELPVVKREVDNLKSYVYKIKNPDLNRPMDAVFYTVKDTDINAVDIEALHLAVKNCNIESVQNLIIEKKVDHTIQDANGKTPLALAYEKLAQDPDNDDLQIIISLLLSVTDESKFQYQGEQA